MNIIKGTVFLFSLLIATVSFGQSNDTSLSKEDYLNKSKRQKSTSSVLVGIGLASVVGGIIYGLSEEGLLFNKERTSGIFVGISLAFATAAIPFRIASKRNYRKAVSLSANFIYPNVPSVKQNVIIAKAYPGLTLKIGL